MKIELHSRYNIGDKASWNAPYGWETVEITKVHFDDLSREFSYSIKGYSFIIEEKELAG